MVPGELLDAGRRKHKRTVRDRTLGPLDLVEDGCDVDPAVLGDERSEPPHCLLELTLAPRTIASAALVPGDREVNEALEKVALVRLGRPPSKLELLVRLEVLGAANQLQTGL
jgi:hypothetical protein